MPLRQTPQAPFLARPPALDVLPLRARLGLAYPAGLNALLAGIIAVAQGVCNSHAYQWLVLCTTTLIGRHPSIGVGKSIAE